MRKTTEPLGRRAERLGYVSAEQVAGVLDKQRERASDGRQPMLLGAMMVEEGLISSDQLAALLDQPERNPYPLSSDAVRLATRIHAEMGEADRMVMVTGADDRDPAGDFARQLAVALAMMDQSPILLIDGDFRHPKQHEAFGAKPSPGLAEMIAGKATVEEATYRSAVANLALLPAGRVEGEPGPVLLSDAAASRLRELRGAYRFIVAASSPLARRPEAAVLASHVDKVVAVLTAGRRRKADVEAVLKALEGLRAGLLGVVLSHRG